MNQLPYKLLIFDWDGTLMDSVGRIVSSVQNSAKNIAAPIPSSEQIRSIIGLNLKEAFDILFPGLSQQQEKQLLQEYRKQYVDLDTTPTPLFPNVKGVLESLKQQGYLLAIATGKARQGLERVLNGSGVESLFDASRCADEAPSKPHPQMLRDLIRHFELSHHECLMIGDTSFDLEMAKNASIDSVGVSYGAHDINLLHPYQPQAIIDDIVHLSNWLDKRGIA